MANLSGINIYCVLSWHIFMTVFLFNVQQLGKHSRADIMHVSDTLVTDYIVTGIITFLMALPKNNNPIEVVSPT